MELRIRDYDASGMALCMLVLDAKQGNSVNLSFYLVLFI